MSGKKVSQLPIYTSAQSGDLFYAVTDVSSKSITGGNFIKTTPVSAAGSTTPRALSVRFKDIVNVKDYGAVGDGITNDQTAFDAAVAASSNNSVYLPDGDYLITTHPGTDVETLGPGRIYLSGTGDVNGKIVHIGVSEATDQFRRGGFSIGGEGPGPDGVLYAPGGGPGLTKVQPTYEGQQLQVQHYSGGYFGIADSVISTAFIDITSGPTLASTPRIAAGDLIGYEEVVYRIKTIEPGATAQRIELETEAGGAVSFASSATGTFGHCYNYNVGTCDTNGTACTWVSGDYYESLRDAAEAYVTIDGVKYDISSRTDYKNLVLSTSAGVQTGVSCVLKTITAERRAVVINLETLHGGNEENLTIFGTIDQKWFIKAGDASAGSNRSIIFRSGTNADDSDRNHMTIHPTGRVFVGRTDPSIVTATTGPKMEIFRAYPTASSGAGVTPVRLLRIGATFNALNPRQIDIGIYDDTGGGYIDSATQKTFYIQPTGGKVLIGAQDPTITFLLQVAGSIGPNADNASDLGSSALRWNSTYSTEFRPGDGTATWTSGSGSPETAVSAAVGSLYTDITGSAATTLYVKESGAGNTGWVAK